MESESELTRKSGRPKRSGLRSLLYGLLILFFIVLAYFVFTVARLVLNVNNTVSQASSSLDPITELARDLFLPATPVILPNAATIVHQINDLARLETVSYEVEKVVTAEDNSDQFFGLLGESIIFVAYGKVYAGIDLSAMTTEDLVVVDPTSVVVHLPDAYVFEDIPALDNERSFVADRDTGLLTRADPALETRVRQEAEVAIREAAAQSDILDRANQNAEAYMRNFLTGLGFTNITFTDERPTDITPYVQPIPKGYVVVTATPAP